MVINFRNQFLRLIFFLTLFVSLQACEEPQTEEDLSEDLIEIPDEYPNEETNSQNAEDSEQGELENTLDTNSNMAKTETKALVQPVQEKIKEVLLPKATKTPNKKEATAQKPKVKIVKVKQDSKATDKSVLVTEVTVCTKEKNGLVAYDARNKKIVYCTNGSWQESNPGMQKALALALKKKSRKKNKKYFYKVRKGAFYCTPGPSKTESFYCSNRIDSAH